ncbi:hypothetical protein K439DRAFT_1043081 [Ramaria rubella]|nr:hypothetical protein K439DRAFT_1043081 [Ramaria rubella]
MRAVFRMLCSVVVSELTVLAIHPPASAFFMNSTRFMTQSLILPDNPSRTCSKRELLTELCVTWGNMDSLGSFLIQSTDLKV